jgi:hypothetical protein
VVPFLGGLGLQRSNRRFSTSERAINRVFNIFETERLAQVSEGTEGNGRLSFFLAAISGDAITEVSQLEMTGYLCSTWLQK